MTVIMQWRVKMTTTNITDPSNEQQQWPTSCWTNKRMSPFTLHSSPQGLFRAVLPHEPGGSGLCWVSTTPLSCQCGVKPRHLLLQPCLLINTRGNPQSSSWPWKWILFCCWLQNTHKTTIGDDNWLINANMVLSFFFLSFFLEFRLNICLVSLNLVDVLNTGYSKHILTDLMSCWSVIWWEINRTTDFVRKTKTRLNIDNTWKQFESP